MTHLKQVQREHQNLQVLQLIARELSTLSVRTQAIWCRCFARESEAFLHRLVRGSTRLDLDCLAKFTNGHGRLQFDRWQVDAPDVFVSA